MFAQNNIQQILQSTRRVQRKEEDRVLAEAKQILQEDLFSEAKVLQNLNQYYRSFEMMNERDCAEELVFTVAEIKKVAINYRLKFLDSAEANVEIPFEAVQKIKVLNKNYSKDLKAFKILVPAELFSEGKNTGPFNLFVKTTTDTYFLVHSWGDKISAWRKLRYWHVRSFENLVAAIAIFTFCVTMSLPTSLITLDNQADYWSGYRGGVFFHLMFFFSGFTAYFVIAFSIALSSNTWNRKQ